MAAPAVARDGVAPSAVPALAAAAPALSVPQATQGWRPAPPAVSILVACGWLRQEDRNDPRLRIDAASSSHELSRVTRPDGQCVVVKRVPERAAARERSLAAEMFVYRLARWMPELARAAPAPVFIDERRQVLVVEALATGRCWSGPAVRVPMSSASACGQLGTLLAGVHRATAHMAMRPSRAVGILGLPGSVEEACADRPAPTQALMRSIAGEPVLAAALDAGARDYAACCVIHGDLRSENWLFDDRAPNPTLKIFDWELAGSGDPAWDLGSLVAEAILDRIQAGCAESGASGMPGAIGEGCRALLQAYFDNETLLDPASGPTWRRLALFAAARLLHVACECADQGVGGLDWPVVEIVAAARRIAHGPDPAAEQLRGWSAPC